MTTEQIIVGIVSAAIALYILHTLRTGQVRAMMVYPVNRRKSPTGYWAVIISNVLVLGVILWAFWSGQFSG